MQTIYGSYYRTLKRNVGTGETVFSFAPSHIVENTYNGLIRCVGNISIYASRMPLMIEGDFKGNVFVCSSCNMPRYNLEANVNVLKYIDDSLTESQYISISECCNNDLSLLTEKDKVKDIIDCFSRTNKTDDEKVYIAKKIIAGLEAITSRDELTGELIKYSVPVDRIEALIKENYSMNDIRKNPYLIFVQNDIPIEIADNMANEYLKINDYATIRMVGYILYELKYQLSQGNTCVRIDLLSNEINKKLKKSLYPEMKISVYLISYYLTFMKELASLHEVNGESYVYLNSVYKEEMLCAEHINRLINSPIKMVQNFNIEHFEHENNITYNAEQKNCTELLKESGIKILTGPPGSGKTAVIRLLIQLFKSEFKTKKIKLAATTGRASQVMKEACGLNAQTLHKLLRLKISDNKRNLNNPIDADLVIVDEVSMMDLQMFSNLLSAVKSNAILLLVGDKDQLESVGYGNVLSDLIKSNSIPIYSLTEVLRSSGSIFENAKKANKGCIDLIEGDDFHIRKNNNIVNLQKSLVRDLNLTNIATLKENQVICPIKGSALGVDALNIIIQQKLMTGKNPILVYNKKLFYLNDKIIMLKNNYIKDYYNGDIGEIIKKYDYEDKIQVKFNDKTIDLTIEDFMYMDLAYVVTAHKSQGSGFENAYIVLPDSAPNMLTRKMIYTAITRAKNNVYIYSMNNALELAITNKNEKIRVSNLKYRIVFKIIQENF